LIESPMCVATYLKSGRPSASAGDAFAVARFARKCCPLLAGRDVIVIVLARASMLFSTNSAIAL
jgi:hypothetical protein